MLEGLVMRSTFLQNRENLGIGTYSQKRFQSEPIKIRKNVLALQAVVIHYSKHNKKIGRAYFEIDKQNEKTCFKIEQKKNSKQETNDLFKTDSLDHLYKKSPDFSSNCNKNKSLFKEEENNAFADFREESQSII